MFDNLFNLFEENNGQDPDRQNALSRSGTWELGEELEYLMEQVADVCEANPGGDFYAAMEPFYKALIRSIVIVPSASPGMEANSCRLVTITRENDSVGIPVFTSETTMGAWITEPSEYFAIPFRVICAKALEEGLDFIVINDAGPARGEISSYELSYLAEGLIPPCATGPQNSNLPSGLLLEESSEIALGIPLIPPSQMLVERIMGCFKQNKQLIDWAYVFQISISHGPPHLAVGVRMSEGQEACWENNLLPDTMAISREVLERNEYMDFFLLNEAEELEESLQGFTQPFYVSQKAS